MDNVLVQLSLLLSNPALLKRLSAEERAQFGSLLSRIVPIESSIIALLIKGMDPAFTFVDPDLTDGHFHSSEGSCPDGGELERYGRNVSSDDVLADLKKRSRRAATAAESLRYWQKHPECREFWIVALGQVWNGQVLVITEFGENRYANLYHFAIIWLEDYSFLSFPL